MNDLRRTADEMAQDVKADEKLYQAVVHASKRRSAMPAIRRKAWVLMPAACACLAVLVFVFVPVLRHAPREVPVIESIAAGGETSTEAPLPALRADLPGGSMTLNTTGEKPSFRNIWSGSSNSSFPMILVNGTYYRLLTTPKRVSDGQLGKAIGSVAVYTTEMSGSGICSNTVLQGETVYAVKGMGNAVIAANIDGSMRAFQQVTAGGAGNVPSSLSQALCQGTVREISLSGVARVTDQATAQRLYDTLLGSASYQGPGCQKTGQSLHIVFANGMTLQMYVSGQTVMSAGSWSCPAFFSMFGT